MAENKDDRKKPAKKQKILFVIAALFALAAVAFVFLKFTGAVSGRGYLLYLCMSGLNLCAGFALWPNQKPIAIVLFVLAVFSAGNAVIRLF